MHEHTQVIAVDAKISAHLVFVALFQEYFAQNAPVAFGQIVEDVPNFCCHLPGGYGPEDIDDGVGQFLGSLVLERADAGRSPVLLQQDIVADGIHKSAKAFRLTDSFGAAQGSEKAREGFLADVFDGLRTPQAGAKFELDQLAEIGNKMLLRAKVSGTKTLQIRRIKGLKLQELASQTESAEHLSTEPRKP